jgi:phenylalanyl-tRNA synthetase alpha chain
VLGDVYRKDEIDKSHYPVFHQMEALRYYDLQTLHDVIEDKFKDIAVN